MALRWPGVADQEPNEHRDSDDRQYQTQRYEHRTGAQVVDPPGGEDARYHDCIEEASAHIVVRVEVPSETRIEGRRELECAASVTPKTSLFHRR